METKVKTAWQECEDEGYVQVTVDTLAQKADEAPEVIKEHAYRLRPKNIEIGNENIKRARGF